jgi:hypothetical protein
MNAADRLQAAIDDVDGQYVLVEKQDLRQVLALVSKYRVRCDALQKAAIEANTRLMGKINELAAQVAKLEHFGL